MDESLNVDQSLKVQGGEVQEEAAAAAMSHASLLQAGQRMNGFVATHVAHSVV